MKFQLKLWIGMLTKFAFEEFFVDQKILAQLF